MTGFLNLVQFLSNRSVMNWKEQLAKYEHGKDWKIAIELMQITINDNPCDLDAYLCVNYLLMNLLVEEDYESSEHNYYAGLLKKYFLESYSKFSDNSEYLFYTGITAHLSEWYFDIDIAEAKAMIKEALCHEPENIIYKWGYYAYFDMSSGGNKQQIAYAKAILRESSIKKMLKSKGALGEYILEIMEHQSDKEITT